MGITDLYEHKYRYSTEHEMPLCPLCRENKESETHFLLHCPALYDLRKKYILSWLDMDNSNSMKLIMSDTLPSNIRATRIYMFKAFQRRQEAIGSVEQDSFFCN